MDENDDRVETTRKGISLLTMWLESASDGPDSGPDKIMEALADPTDDSSWDSEETTKAIFGLLNLSAILVCNVAMLGERTAAMDALKKVLGDISRGLPDLAAHADRS